MVERSVALKAMGDAILAWEMNGAPLSLAHGGPLRLVVPGYNGVNNVKYVKRVALTPTESQAKIQVTGYRITPLGEQSKASEPSVQELNVKSFVAKAAAIRRHRADAALERGDDAIGRGLQVVEGGADGAGRAGVLERVAGRARRHRADGEERLAERHQRGVVVGAARRAAGQPRQHGAEGAATRPRRESSEHAPPQTTLSITAGSRQLLLL